MASIRRTDIMHKKYPKGRPAKSEREKTNRRQESYKWRDARRVYLASSFDRWRKLRSTLKLKDSSLAWHLMEAHEKGQCTICRQSDTSSNTEQKADRRKCDQKEFLPSLIASIRQLSHAHFDFGECIEIVGLLCLEFDKKRKENFSINELIKSGLKPALPSYISKSLHNPSDHVMDETDSSLSLSELHSHKPDEIAQNEVTTAHTKEHPHLTSLDSYEIDAKSSVSTIPFVHVMTPSDAVTEKSTDVSFSNIKVEHPDITAEKHPSPFSSQKMVNHIDDYSSQVESKCTEQKEEVCMKDEPGEEGRALNATIDSSVCSESDRSLEIDVERLNSSQEEQTTPQQKYTGCQNFLSSQTSLTDKGVDLSRTSPTACSSSNTPCNTDAELSFAKAKSEAEDVGAVSDALAVKTYDADLPLDMTMLKQERAECQSLPSVPVDLTNAVIEELALLETDILTSTADGARDTFSPSQKSFDGSHCEEVQCSPSAGRRKTTMETSSGSSSASRRSPFWSESLQSKLGKQREDSHTSIPWQRRDMSRKEEYEYLELNPFSDLADFSQRYPHVHQRTYYRWKRRIKEEYIILEQCPEMSFQEFSSIVLQAKESVFCHWKSLIAQGKGFFAPSDTSKRLEAKWSIKSGAHQNNEYTFMQKNLSLTYEQFCQQYPGTSLDAFNVIKRKAMQDFWLFYQNQHMGHKEFSKIVNVSEDVFNSWKDYVESLRTNSLSPNLKTISSGVSPTSPLPGFQSIGNVKPASSELPSQSTKDSLFSIMNSNAALKESLAAVQASALTPALSESMARSMSTSYLASLQNMMFPWHSYYGMASPLGQQMLPMMLWPGMMGLTGGMTNPLGLMSSPHASSVSRASADLHSPFLGITSESNKTLDSDDPQGKSDFSHKRPASEDGFELISNHATSEGEKKLKLSHETEDVDFWSSNNRSRKQNKQEYIYYLKNPELGFKELESLFPTISLRTFYRWRKEMNASVLLIEDNKDMTFQQFKMVFPDIPEEIFESWKEKAEKGIPPVGRDKHHLIFPESNCPPNGPLADDRRSLEQSLAMDRNIATCSPQSGEGDATHHKKCSRAEYLFVQKNPDVDFATFSKFYPDISVRSFYRWKKELRDAVEFIQANPNIDFQTYRTMDATVSEGVFNVWKSHVQNDSIYGEKTSDVTHVNDNTERLSSQPNRKVNGPEYWFLQLNPYLEFSQFNRTYPDVPKRTFYRWKQEIQQIMDYIRGQPRVEFADIASILPGLSQDAFIKWKQIIASEADTHTDTENTGDIHNVEDSQMKTPVTEIDEHTKNQMTEALLYLMHNPTIRYTHFKSQFDFVSPATFELWLNRIKTVILHIASNPGIDYASFSVNIKDVAEDIFDKWKSLGPDDIAAMDLGCKEAGQAYEASESSAGEEQYHGQYDSTEVAQNAFEFCQRNPRVTFASLQEKYPSVSERVFYTWMTRIEEELKYIQDNPESTFKDFSKHFPGTREELFKYWSSEFHSSKDSQSKHFFRSSEEEKLDEMQSSECSSKESRFHTSNGKTGSSELHCREEESYDSQLKGNYRQNHDGFSLHFADSYNRGKDLPTDPDESSLSKLAKFADASAASYLDKYQNDRVERAYSKNIAEIFTDSKNQEEMKMSLRENVYKNNNNETPHADPSSSPLAVENFLNVPAAHHLPLQEGQDSSGESGDMFHANMFTSSMHNSSLSALMAMSRNKEPMNKVSEASNLKKERSVDSVPPSPGNCLWKSANSGTGATGNSGTIKEDDEAFSSQRQKKMSRAEYLFVRDNPDVDSQEFSRIFPGVSARTFYRWKKEIKAQLQLA